uniref:Uncharacterized protein n=1 Tax=Salarias fasciatus TaxID=181472 RepID=A0A672I0E4_SALFA
MRFRDQLYPLLKDPVDPVLLDQLLRRELDSRSASAAALHLTGIPEECREPPGELRRLEAQLEAELQEARSRNGAVLQALQGAPQGAPQGTALSLLVDNRRLSQELQQAQDRLQALRLQLDRLQDARDEASSRVSNQQRATQLLQTELQDSRALLQDRDSTIQTLQSRLRQSQTEAAPGATELEKLRTRLLQMEATLRSAMGRLSSLLEEREDQVRKLKETLRRHQGDEPGESGDASVTKTHTSILAERDRGNREQTHVFPPSVVSSQQEEISKWKSRAQKLKLKTRLDPEKPPSPRTPSKRPPALGQFLGSPKKLDSPKSRFFDAGSSSDVLSRTYRRKFFDNSRLGAVRVSLMTDDDLLCVPDAALDSEKDWCPLSPSQQDMCKTQ